MGNLEVFDSIEKFSREEWDGLCGGWLTANHAWHTLMERTWRFPLRARYFALHEGGRLCAAAACYELEDRTDSGSLRERLKALATRLGCSLFPALLVGPIGWRGRHLIASPELDAAERSRVCAELLDGIERYARERALPVALRDLPADEPALLAELARRGYQCVPSEPQTYLDIEWGSFREYVGWLSERSSGMAGKVRNEVNRFKKAGLQIRPIEDVTVYGSRLIELTNEHYRRLNQRDFPFHADHFVQLQRAYGEALSIDGLFRGEELLGLTSRLARGRVSIAMHVAVHASLVRQHAAFFNLVFYHPIAQCIAAGTQRLYYGRLNYQAKLARGCRLMDTYFCYRASGARALLTRPLLAWNRHQARRAFTPGAK